MFETNLRRFGWDGQPWQELRRLQNRMSRLFEEIPVWAQREYPAINMWVGDEDIILTAELPGLEAKDLDISVEGSVLAIRGSRIPDTLKEGESYHRQERESGKFERTVQLPFPINPDLVEARLEKGILQLNLPRAEQDKPRKIVVKP